MAEELAAVIDEIRAAKPVPFSTSAMVNRKDLVERLEELRENLPLEIKRAAHVVASQYDFGEFDARVFAERVLAVPQLLDDLVGYVGLGALTGFVAVSGMVACAVAELIER